jgi:poly-gamma-glutamate capsule biosynthesis protein CapA/YwtB (metallophosphatase superfamily)
MRLLSFLLALVSFCSYAQISTDTVLIKKDTVSIIGVGDIMMGTNYPEDKLPSEDGAFLLRDVEKVLSDADVTFGNLEGTLLDSGGVPKKCKDPKVCYAFRTPVRYVKNLVNAGFDMMSLANNHAGDMGEEGRKSSMTTLEEAGIVHAGQITHKLFLKKTACATAWQHLLPIQIA